MSEWKERANKRRAERRTIVPAIRPPGGSKKDTKKWCRGKVGVPHNPHCKTYEQHKRWAFKNWWLLVCADCNKELDSFWISPFRMGRATKIEIPAWVDDPAAAEAVRQPQSDDGTGQRES